LNAFDTITQQEGSQQTSASVEHVGIQGEILGATPVAPRARQQDRITERLKAAHHLRIALLGRNDRVRLQCDFRRHDPLRLFSTPVTYTQSLDHRRFRVAAAMASRFSSRLPRVGR
jgi:hypothetical protein